MNEDQLKRLEELMSNLQTAYTNFNDQVLPAIQHVIEEKLSSLGCQLEAKRINDIEKRVSTLEKEVQQLKKAV